MTIDGKTIAQLLDDSYSFVGCHRIDETNNMVSGWFVVVKSWLVNKCVICGYTSVSNFNVGKDDPHSPGCGLRGPVDPYFKS